MKRFWKGKKRAAKKRMRRGDHGKWRNFYFNHFFKNGLPKIGDLTHDCTGQNHVITRITGEIGMAMGWWNRMSELQCYWTNLKNDEICVCPCLGQGYQVPAPVEWIREYAQSFDEELAKKWNMEDSRKFVFDDRGVRIE